MSQPSRRPSRLRDAVKSKAKRGHFVSASADVLVHGLRVVREGDDAVLDNGTSVFATGGAGTVLVNHRPLHRVTDDVDRGRGHAVQGGPHVLVGESRRGSSEARYEGGFRLLDFDGMPRKGVRYVVRAPGGVQHWGRTDRDGCTHLVYTDSSEDIEIEIVHDGPCGT